MKTSLLGKKNLAGLDVFRVLAKALYNGMDAIDGRIRDE